MSSLGYILRHTAGIRWVDSHNKVFRNDCWRYYRVLNRNLFRVRICSGDRCEMSQYFGSVHYAAVEMLRLAIVVAAVVLAIVSAAGMLTRYEMRDVPMAPETVR